MSTQKMSLTQQQTIFKKNVKKQPQVHSSNAFYLRPNPARLMYCSFIRHKVLSNHPVVLKHCCVLYVACPLPPVALKVLTEAG